MRMQSALAVILLLSSPSGAVPASEVTVGNSMVLQVAPETEARDVQRIGINLGGWSSWGAEQLGSNIIQNPGLEGIVDRALATVKTVQGKTLRLGVNATWRDEEFWNGAELTFRTGKSAGNGARVLSFKKDASSHEEWLITDYEGAAAPGDVVALTRTSDASEPTQWWVGANGAKCPSGSSRPGSPGKRSFRLCPEESQPAELNSFLDTITDRAGKLLPIQGKWRFSFWATADPVPARLEVSFGRQHANAFFSKNLDLRADWHQTIIEFNAMDAGPAGPLQLRFAGSGGSICLDDVSLVRISDGDFPFRTEVVRTLERLHPGYLRDWQGQLGDTLENRLALPFARRPMRYRSGNREDAHFGYSLPEFLALCKRVGANPWIILPTTFSDDENRKMGEYLRDAQSDFHFREILVEFGNENWNPLFAVGGIQNPITHGEAASRAFSSVRAGAGDSVPVRTVINAQFANPAKVEEFARAVPADIVAVAPYFATELPAGARTEQIDALLFDSAETSLRKLHSAVTGRQKELAVYEVNLHTVGGSASAAERNQMVLGAAAGSALANRLMEDMSWGVRSQCVYVLSGFDAYTLDGKGLVELWGVSRDLASLPRLRSTGLALGMLNQSVQAELHRIQATSGGDSGVNAVAFRGSSGWSAAVVSRRAEPILVSLRFPAMTGTTLPATILTLTEDQNSNPRKEGVTSEPRQSIVQAGVVLTDAHSVQFRVPGRGFVVLLPHSSSLEDSREGKR